MLRLTPPIWTMIFLGLTAAASWLAGLPAISWPPHHAAIGMAIFFAGFFFYIGAAALAPASHRALPRLWTSLATLAGMAFIWVVVRLASG